MNENIKNIDSLGRIVIPKGIRKSLKINDNTMFNVGVLNKDIVLTRIETLESINNELLLKILKTLLNNDVLITNMNKIVLSTKQELNDLKLSNTFINLVSKRTKQLINDLHITDYYEKNSNFLICPILKNSILYGSIVIFLKNIEEFNKNEILFDLIMNLYLETFI